MFARQIGWSMELTMAKRSPFLMCVLEIKKWYSRELEKRIE
jgi:hypothetical protein